MKATLRACLLVAACLPQLLLAQVPGDLDSTFDGDGKLFIAEEPKLIRAQESNVLYLTGTGSIHRLLDDGSPDLSFGDSGVCQVDSLNCKDIIMLGAGDFLLVGTLPAPFDRISTIRFHSNGTMDTTYGTAGRFVFQYPWPHHSINNAFLQPDGRLLISAILDDSCAVLRLLPQGSLDPTFAQNGYFTRLNGLDHVGVACLGNGQIVFVYRTNGILLSSDGTFPPWVAPHDWDGLEIGGGNNAPPIMIIVNDADEICTRFLASGPDDHGSCSGIKRFGTTHGSYFYNGIPYSTNPFSHALVSSFWFLTTPWYGNITSMTKDPAGSFFATGGYTGSVVAPWRIWRFTPQGLRDSSFAVIGLLETEFSPGEHCMPLSSSVQADGKLLVAGWATIGGVDQWVICRYHNIPDPRAKLGAHVFLGGPYDPVIERMSDGLRTNNLLPSTSPYQALGFTAVGSSDYQTIHSGVLDFTGDSAIVDWLWIELLSAADTSTIAAARAALVRRDGLVVGMDGRSPVDFNCGSGSYYVRVRHRNHLGVTASAPVSLSATSTEVDFTSTLTNTFGSNAQDEINGKRMLWPGDVTGDGIVKYVGASNDRDAILAAIGGVSSIATLTAYDPADVNMDGTVKYAGLNNDRDRILLAIGGTSVTAVRVEQGP